MKKTHSVEILVAMLLLATMALAMLSIHAGNRHSEHWGPRLIERAPDGNVWLTVDQDLLIASPTGELRHKVDLAALGLPGPLNALAPLSDDGAGPRMLAGVIDSPEWLIMDGKGKVAGHVKPEGIEQAYRETFHLAVAPDGRTAMATSGGHRVLLFGASNKRSTESPPDLFRYANGIWHEDGRWWVVDTNHGKLRALSGSTLQSESSIDVPPVGAARFPALARRSPAGGFTVSEMQNGMDHGVVIEISEAGQLLHQYISRAEDSEPVAFLWLDEQLLLADRADYSLQRFDADGRYLSNWGDEQIGAALKASWDERRSWANKLLYAQIGAVTLGLLGILGYAAWKQRKIPVGESNGSLDKLATPSLEPVEALKSGLRMQWPLILGALILALMSTMIKVIAKPMSTLLQPLIPEAAIVAIIFVPVILLFPLALFAARYLAANIREPEYEALLSSRWVRWLKASATVRASLMDQESAREVLMVMTSKLFPAFNMNVWVLTDKRLLVFRPGPGYDGKLLAAINRRDCSATIEPATGWRRFFGGRDSIRVATRDGRNYSGYAGSPVTAARIAALLGARLSPSTAWARTSTAPDMRSPEPGTAFVLSAVVPGLAQLRQDRFSLGITLLTGAGVTLAAVVVPVLLGWLGHFYDVPTRLGVLSLLAYATWVVLAAADAFIYARRAHRR